MANKTRPKQMILRLTEEEKEKISKKIITSKLTQNEYLLRCAMNKEIIIVEGLKEYSLELKKIGNNLNQLTMLAHQGKVDCGNEVEEIRKELNEVWQQLRQLLKKPPQQQD